MTYFCDALFEWLKQHSSPPSKDSAQPTGKLTRVLSLFRQVMHEEKNVIAQGCSGHMLFVNLFLLGIWESRNMLLSKHLDGFICQKSAYRTGIINPRNHVTKGWWFTGRIVVE